MSATLARTPRTPWTATATGDTYWDGPLPSGIMERLASIDLDALAWHEAHYSSAEMLANLVRAARGECPHIRPVSRMDLCMVCWECEADGASYGVIGCLAGQPLEVWCWLLTGRGIETYQVRDFNRSKGR